jgi:hypothetical protein
VVKKKERSPAPRRAAAVPRTLVYKVVELSTVDEGAIEHAVNEWVGQGWTFDGLQFAIRESSKRPSMAFVFFTRPGHPLAAAAGDDGPARSADEAERHLRRMVDDGAAIPAPVSAWDRLAELAGEGDDEG